MIISYQGKQPQLHPTIYMAEGSKLIGDVTMGEDSSVWFNAVLRADLAPIRIGKRCNIQDNTVGHVNTDQPLVLGDDVSVGHAAIIHGCSIGTGSLIGMGAILLNGAEIGEFSLIGAGSVVTENSKIPPYTLALGTPAKVIRELTEADLQRMSKTTLGYVIKGREYRSS
ncbi:carbonic anhydrase/acetyltransferase-like protein (isoleucine patch superfamily) [Paenibacillus sp. JGP012]|uniref:gamma carbonic anhydrase family protein n=1 Tax=Paenibacillus sp. JGP012 TaxID=2735914 RepID=UPI0016134383|nr:gamma carbonic anhydrase family protein [Paenibacillus sp. JGP012]MBB6022589.1 carbonic anhydrase/acetyltransferase-like protein (isoleucine patch superfamily) [Paenibacillus sp. JGP012]